MWVFNYAGLREERTVAGKGSVKFTQYLSSFEIPVTTAVAQEQLPSLLIVDTV